MHLLSEVATPGSDRNAAIYGLSGVNEAGLVVVVPPAGLLAESPES